MTDMESLDRAVEEAREGITEAVGAACSLAYRIGEFIGFGVRWGPDIDRISRAQDRVDSILEKRSKAFEAAVSAKARAEERASRLLVVHCRDCSWSREADSGRWAEELRMRHEQVNETHNVWIADRARSSEEAEVCLHPLVSRMAAVGGPIICGVCGEEAGNGG